MSNKKKMPEILDDIKDHYIKMRNIIFRQMDILETMISNKSDGKELYVEMEKNEDKLDAFEVSIDAEIINVMALHQPTATDLRFLITILRMVNRLERVGDLTLNIVHCLERPGQALSDRYVETASTMLAITNNMVKKALESFDNKDKDCAIWTIKNDQIVDELFHKSVKNAVNKLTVNDDVKVMVNEILNMNNVVSSIERIADHATNMAEASVYYLKGIDLRHNLEESNAI